MKQVDKEALVLFKDYTHLQLKSFQIHLSQQDTISGCVDSYEKIVLQKALNFHRIYTHIKLNNVEKQNKQIEKN